MSSTVEQIQQAEELLKKYDMLDFSSRKRGCRIVADVWELNKYSGQELEDIHQILNDAGFDIRGHFASIRVQLY